MKALKTAAVVVGAAAAIVVTAGAAIPAVGAAVTGALGVSMATIGAIGAAANLAAGLLSSLTTAKPKPMQAQGQATEFKADPSAPIEYIVGRTASAGYIVDRDTWGKDNAAQGFAIVYGGGGPYESFEAFLADRAEVNFSGEAATGKFQDWMWYNWQRGNTPSIELLSPSAGPLGRWPAWNPGRKLSGLCAAIWALRFDVKEGKKFAGGVPKPLAVIRGAKVYDPRQDSTQPGGSGACRALDESTYVGGAAAENPFCHAVTWALGRWANGKRVLGVGMPADSFDWPAWVDAMNVADANGWKVGGIASSADEKWNVLKAMCQAGGGEPIRNGALLSVLVNAPKVSVTTIESHHIVGQSSVAAAQPARNRWNTAVPRCRSEEHGWETVDLEPITQAAYLAEDGEQRTQQVDLQLVQYDPATNQPAELAAYECANAREFGPIALEVKPQFIGLVPGDAVDLDIPELGFTGQKAIVLSRSLNVETGAVTLGLRSETDAKHSFALGETATPPPTPALGLNIDVDEPDPPAAGDWTATAGLDLANNGVVIPSITFTGSVDNERATEVVFYIRPTGGTWRAIATLPADTTTFTTSDVRPNTEYETGFKYLFDLGAPTAIIQTETVNTETIAAGDLVGAGDLAFRDDVYFGSPYLLDDLGGVPATRALYRTDLGTAAAFVGQGTLATQDNVAWDLDLTGRPTALTDLNGGLLKTGYIKHTADGALLSNRWPGEAGANVTETRTAAAITGQGAFATKSKANWNTTDLDIPTGIQSGNLTSGGYVRAEKSYYGEGTGPSPYVRMDTLRPGEFGANVTETRTAAAITGQGALATKSQAAWGSDLSGRPNFAVDVTLQSGLDRVKSNYVFDLVDNKSLYALMPGERGANVTETRTAAAITGQGALATVSDADGVPDGASRKLVTTMEKQRIEVVPFGEELTELFDYPNGAGYLDRWQPYNGLAPNVSWVTGDPNVPGGTYVRYGNNTGNDMAWFYWDDEPLPYDPTAMYEVEAVLRRVGGAGSCYIGLEALAADKATLLNTSGSNTHSSAHYVAASNFAPGGTWVTVRGYVSGYGATNGEVGGTGTNKPTSPAKMHPSTRYIRPMFLLNYNGVAGTMDIAFIRVRKVTRLMVPGSTAQLGGPLNLRPINAANEGNYIYTGAVSYSTTTTLATVSVAAGNLKMGGEVVAYNAMSVDVPGTAGTSKTVALTIDDPDFAGGSKTLGYTESAETAVSANGRIIIGSVTISFPSSGTGGGTGGGGGYCTAHGQFVLTPDGPVEIDAALPVGLPIWARDDDGTWGFHPIEHVTHAPARCFAIVGENGARKVVSFDTPVPTAEGYLTAEQVDGHLVETNLDGVSGWTRASLEPAGTRQVAKITVGNRCYAGASDPGGPWLVTHNAKPGGGL